jgi:hypothetical protein
MQTNEIKEATPLDQFVWNAVPAISPALSYLICLAGIFVCVWAFRKSRKLGYLVIGAYFLYPFVELLLGLFGHIFGHPPISPDSTFVHDGALQHIQVVRRSIRLPIFSGVVLLGIWLLAKEDKSGQK